MKETCFKRTSKKKKTQVSFLQNQQNPETKWTMGLNFVFSWNPGVKNQIKQRGCGFGLKERDLSKLKKKASDLRSREIKNIKYIWRERRIRRRKKRWQLRRHAQIIPNLRQSKNGERGRGAARNGVTLEKKIEARQPKHYFSHPHDFPAWFHLICIRSECAVHSTCSDLFTVMWDGRRRSSGGPKTFQLQSDDVPEAFRQCFNGGLMTFWQWCIEASAEFLVAIHDEGRFHIHGISYELDSRVKIR